MKRTIASLLFLIGLSFAVTASAEVVTYFNDFSTGKIGSGTYRVDDGSATYGTSLAPFYSNLRYYENGGSNLRFTLGEERILLANANGCYGTLQMDASNFLSSATNFDLTAGDLVYECFYTCSWNSASPGNFHHGISINNNQVTFIYHPGYGNGAFRIEGAFGKISNQNIGFTPVIGNTNAYTMMKLTIHRDDDAGNYVFKTEFGQATRTDDGWETNGYTYQYNYTCSIATVDAAGGIQSIGPYGYHGNNTDVTNLRLEAPFSNEAVSKAQNYSSSLDYVVYTDKPVHWYKFNDASTNVIADSGSNPIDGTARNVDMSAISELRQAADFSGNYSKVDLTGTANLTGDWTAEFVINPHNISGRQALVSGDNGSLRWIMSNGTPGFTKWGAYDAVFKGPDGTSAFSYDLSQIVDEWIHVAYVRQGNDLFLYINGELVGKNASNQPAIDLPISRTIGSNGDGEAFAGIIDDIAFYSTALTAEQIMNHAFPETVTAKYYNVRSTDISADSWTIDGANKKGVVFVEGAQDTAEFDNSVVLDADGTFETSVGKNLTVSGVVSGDGVLEKIGAGTLTLSGDNTFGSASIEAGTLTLTDDAIKANSSFEIASGATLEYNVPEGEKQLTFSNDATVFGGNVLKTGDGKLKILAEDNQFQSDNFTVKEGELDFKGKYIGKLEINDGAVFSPGNSVGALDITGDFTLKQGSTLLLEFNETDADSLSVSGLTTIEEGAIIALALEDGASPVPGQQISFQLPDEIDTFDLAALSSPFYLTVLGYDPWTGILSAYVDANAVPEPSTWALMILGAAGLLYWRKRKNA